MPGQVRPNFEMLLGRSVEDVGRAVDRRLRAPGCPVGGLVAPGRIELHVRGDAHHMWSPQLVVDLEEQAPERTRLRGRFGPHPSVWTMFVGGYAISAFVALAGLLWGIAQFLMGDGAWALLAVPVGLLLGAGLYALAFLGQDLSEVQMDELRIFLEETLA